MSDSDIIADFIEMDACGNGHPELPLPHRAPTRLSQAFFSPTGAFAPLPDLLQLPGMAFARLHDLPPPPSIAPPLPHPHPPLPPPPCPGLVSSPSGVPDRPSNVLHDPLGTEGLFPLQSSGGSEHHFLLGVAQAQPPARYPPLYVPPSMSPYPTPTNSGETTSPEGQTREQPKKPQPQKRQRVQKRTQPQPRPPSQPRPQPQRRSRARKPLRGQELVDVWTCCRCARLDSPRYFQGNFEALKDEEPDRIKPCTFRVHPLEDKNHPPYCDEWSPMHHRKCLDCKKWKVQDSWLAEQDKPNREKAQPGSQQS